jgi:hypothetical protein
MLGQELWRALDMPVLTITDRDEYLVCQKCDEVVSGEFDPISRVLELKCPMCEAHVKAKLYFGGPIPVPE